MLDEQIRLLERRAKIDSSANAHLARAYERTGRVLEAANAYFALSDLSNAGRLLAKVGASYAPTLALDLAVAYRKQGRLAFAEHFIAQASPYCAAQRIREERGAIAKAYVEKKDYVSASRAILSLLPDDWVDSTQNLFAEVPEDADGARMSVIDSLVAGESTELLLQQLGRLFRLPMQTERIAREYFIDQAAIDFVSLERLLNPRYLNEQPYIAPSDVDRYMSTLRDHLGFPDDSYKNPARLF